MTTIQRTRPVWSNAHQAKDPCKRTTGPVSCDASCDDRCAERGSVTFTALFVLIILSLLGAAFLGLSNNETIVVANAVASEGAFYAAEAAIQTGIDQLSPNAVTSTQPIATTDIGTSYQYRSGARSDTGPQALDLMGTQMAPGYSAESGTGYSQSGYIFYVYGVNATGTGPRNAQREIDVRVQYGPVSQ